MIALHAHARSINFPCQLLQHVVVLFSCAGVSSDEGFGDAGADSGDAAAGGAAKAPYSFGSVGGGPAPYSFAPSPAPSAAPALASSALASSYCTRSYATVHMLSMCNKSLSTSRFLSFCQRIPCAVNRTFACSPHPFMYRSLLQGYSVLYRMQPLQQASRVLFQRALSRRRRPAAREIPKAATHRASSPRSHVTRREKRLAPCRLTPRPPLLPQPTAVSPAVSEAVVLVVVGRMVASPPTAVVRTFCVRVCVCARAYERKIYVYLYYSDFPCCDYRSGIDRPAD